MGEYANIKSKSFLKVLEWLENSKSIKIIKGGRHQIKIESIASSQSFSLPTSHAELNKYIIKQFVRWLVKNNICTKKEFDEKL